MDCQEVNTLSPDINTLSDYYLRHLKGKKKREVKEERKEMGGEEKRGVGEKTRKGREEKGGEGSTQPVFLVFLKHY